MQPKSTLPLFLFVFSLLQIALFGTWAHIELGAGNYGQDGHDKYSRTRYCKPVMQEELMYIKGEPKNFDPALQYAVLFWTLDELVTRFGTDEGIFHVNDLYNDYAEYGAICLEEYAEIKGYSRIIIETVPGDFKDISTARLMRHGKTHYDSAHLKNTETRFYTGDREEFRAQLQKFANLSSHGLYFFYRNQGAFFPKAEATEYVQRGIFYQETDDWSAVPYFFPEDRELSVEGGKVVFIPNREHSKKATFLMESAQSFR
ncbi:MAG: hypothetical protein KR126chlam1_01179 [Chlamydiae bacterium]|nr:hypothetical protein [Chlamydiota bacterium]